MSDPEDYLQDPEEELFAQLSESYEQVIKTNRLIRRCGKIALVGFPILGAANYFFAHQDLTGSYVAGAAITGLVFGIGTEAMAVWSERKIIDPIIEASLNRFEEESN